MFNRRKLEPPPRPSGFSLIELVGAMIIIAVLTVAGIAAVSTAIENSRQTAVREDLDGFRTVLEQFLVENPQYAKWDGVNNGDLTRKTLDALNNDYLEGEMKFATNPGRVSTTTALVDLVRKDPWGNPYQLALQSRKYQTVTGENTESFLRLCVRSFGPNSSNTYDGNVMSSDDTNDIYLISQFSSGKLHSIVFTSDIRVEQQFPERRYYDRMGFSETEQKWMWLAD
ncbi:MAG: prepilin-type N-terminal cleavage/methylation domain-containing protein, partial [Acinetobacter sp.]